jgi:hypothetical protein
VSWQASPSLALEQVDHRFVVQRRVAVDTPDSMADEQPRRVPKQQSPDTAASMHRGNAHVVDRRLVKAVAGTAVVDDRKFSGMSLDRVPLAPPSRKRARGPLLV